MKQLYKLMPGILFMLSSFLTFAGDVPAPVKKTSRSNNEKSAHHVVGGNGFTVELRAGKIFSWGKNNHGQLGNNTTTNSLTPVQESSGADNWVDITAGFGQVLALKADGTLWAWGQNNKGQLGIGTFTDSNIPMLVGTANDWVTIACGGTHSMAIKANGTLWAWGNNANGQLGIGTPSAPMPSPVPVGSAHSWIGISAGFFHSAAIQSNGALFTWGLNNVGQLGINTTVSQLAPLQVGNSHVWKSVECGQYHTMGLQSNGTLWGWGKNNAGQLGDNSVINRLSPVQEATFATNWVGMACGQADTNSIASHTIAIKADGTLYGFGSNQFGQLGTATGTNSLVPILVTSFADAINVECGWACSFVRKSNGQLFAYGNNASGNLGNGNTTNASSPIAVSIVPSGWSSVQGGGDFSFAIAGNGTIYAWGNDNNGQLGNGIVSGAVPNPTQIGNSNNWKSIFTGTRHAVGIKSDGTLFTWGNNSNGQLGNGTNATSSNPVQVNSANANWISASCGDKHTMAIKSDGTLWGWGFNQFGQLGTGNNVDSNIPVQIGTQNDWVDVECSGNITHIIKSNGTLWAMGENTSGQLGTGTASNASIPVEVGISSNWISVSSGTTHTVGIQSDGTMWAWGSNNAGNLGNNSSVPETSPVQIGGGINWVSISCGTDHSIAQAPDGTIYTWGLNQSGELGNGTNNNSGVPSLISTQSGVVFINCGASHTAIIKADRTLICETGLNSTGQLGDGGFSNRNFFGCTIGIPCNQADAPGVNASPNPICAGNNSGLTITSGNLNDDTSWQWYSDSLLTVSAGSGTSITVSPSTTHTYFVRGEGACNPGQASSVTVTVNSTPASAPVLSGPTVVCQLTTATYTAIASGATTYNWTVPSGLTITSGQGTASINVNVLAGTVNGNITCSAFNSCGISAASSLAVTKKPAVPGTISGTSSLCGQTSATYSISPVFGATSYNWSLPAGISILSGTGTTSISVNITTGFIGGNIGVSAVNACGNVPGTTLFVTGGAPATPGLIAGPTNVCGLVTVTYSIPAVAYATGYIWTVPTWMTISSGQGSTSITATVGNAAGGTLSVAATNVCGAGTARTINLTVAAIQPGVISGPTNICGISSANYSIANVASGYIYNWSFAMAGWSISTGQGTTGITISGPSTGTPASGLVKVTSSNGCGNTSAARSLGVTYCHNPVSMGNGPNEKNDFSVFPNPASDYFIINLTSDVDIVLMVEVYDLLGNKVICQQHSVVSGESTIKTNIEDLNTGMYFVRVMDGNNSVLYSERIIKQ